MFKSLDEIKAANAEVGGSFFDKSHANVGSRVSTRIYPTDTGAVVVSSKPGFYAARVWTIWKVSQTGYISVIGEPGGYESDSAAHTAAREAARANGWGNGPKRARTLGEMTSQDRREAIKRAAAAFQSELDQTAPQIGAILDQDLA